MSSKDGGGGGGGGGRLRLRVFAGERLSEFEVTDKRLEAGEATVGDLKALLQSTPDYGGPYRRFSFVTSALESAADDAPLALFDLAQGVDIEAFTSPSPHDPVPLLSSSFFFFQFIFIYFKR
jgi:hypothetical protein